MDTCRYYSLENLENNNSVFGSQIESVHHCNKGWYANERGRPEKQNYCKYFKDFSKCLIKNR